ncbi:SGNH/GDSL hydrolase family protein [Paenibacillus oenotherae]|uniref:SGNH/GDSL hydrolase family protein n=1 Tax=Paenibacillus oenotherae TaxID=1435645 RepID=A0ABS7D0S2_9BACL|nr:SGNH/GDSL hydrolase family protein [Paenibacillus oenotherae]MBW7473366.1 SGNH/GDSL hydrolase family protein [Paenibacillus oenotherae]
MEPKSMLLVLAGNSLSLPRPHQIKAFDPATERGLAISYTDTYGYLLNLALARQYPEYAVSVQNRSQRGYSILDVLHQIEDHLYYFQPDYLILHIGIVDCWYRAELEGRSYVNIQTFTKSCLKLVEHMRRRPETNLLVIGIAPTSCKMEERYPGILQQIADYNHVLSCIADHHQIHYVDLASHISPHDPQQYLLPDDQHLNKEGNKLVCQQLLQVIRSGAGMPKPV